jgi:hypothetical protein
VPRRHHQPETTYPHDLYLAESPAQADRIVDILKTCRGEYTYSRTGNRVILYGPKLIRKSLVAEWSQFIAGVLCSDANPVKSDTGQHEQDLRPGGLQTGSSYECV